MPKKPDAPVLLVRWYDYTKWLLERVDSFPKNQRFIFGTRLADAVLGIMELLVEASYSRTKLELLRRANVKIEQLRWIIRLAKDRAVLTPRQQKQKGSFRIFIYRNIRNDSFSAFRQFHASVAGFAR
jgi:hypothetical protein